MTAALALAPESTALIARMRETAAAVGAIVEVRTFATAAEETQAAELLRAIKTLALEGEEARKALKAPHLNAGREVDDAFAGPRKALERVEAMIKRRLSEAAEAREAARRAALVTAQAAVARADHETASAALESIDMSMMDAPAGITTRWTYEVESVDLRAVPLEFVQLNMDRVRAEIATANREGRPPAVPGLTFRKSAGIAARRLP